MAQAFRVFRRALRRFTPPLRVLPRAERGGGGFEDGGAFLPRDGVARCEDVARNVGDTSGRDIPNKFSRRALAERSVVNDECNCERCVANVSISFR